MVGEQVREPIPSEIRVSGDLRRIVVDPAESDGREKGQEGQNENGREPEPLVPLQRRTFLLDLALGHGAPHSLERTRSKHGFPTGPQLRRAALARILLNGSRGYLFLQGGDEIGERARAKVTFCAVTN